MSTLKRSTLAVALAAALPALAADPAIDTQKELQALKARVAELEKKAAPAEGGMTAEQLKDFNRIAVKTEALEDGRDAAGLKGFVVSGWADVNYLWNVNQERAGFQFLVPVDKAAYGYDNSYLGTIALDVQKETDGGTKYRLTLVPKRSTGDVMGEASVVHEATVSIPLGGDLKLFAGQIPDWQGYEYLPPTQNKLITHNLLFDFTLPSAYTGAGLEFSLGPIAMKAALVNVNTSIRSVGESVPALVFRGDYEGSEFWGLGFAGVTGKKANYRAYVDAGFGLDPDTGLAIKADDSLVSGKDTWVHTLEVDGWYTRGDVTLNAQVSYGQQEKAAITAAADGSLRDSEWIGASVLAAYKLTPRLEGVLRGDYVYNRENGGGLLDWVEADAANGLGPDPAGDAEKGTDRYAATVGVNYAFNENTTFKLEYRYDGATKKVFAKNSDGSLVNHNSLVSAGVVVFF